MVIVSDAHIVCRQYRCSRDIILGRREKDSVVLVRKKKLMKGGSDEKKKILSLLDRIEHLYVN